MPRLSAPLLTNSPMTLRDVLALEAWEFLLTKSETQPIAILTRFYTPGEMKETAERAYAWADAMIAARGPDPEPLDTRPLAWKGKGPPE